MKRSNDSKKFIFNITLIVILVCCFFITTYAVTRNLLSIEDNLFVTGRTKINLTEGQSIIDNNDFLLEPGMTVSKDFFIENQGTVDVYYKVYFVDVSGGLSDILEVTIKNDDKVLYEGNISELSRKKVKAVDDILEINEKMALSVFLHYPEDAKNDTENSNISFRLGVDAVQIKNNPNKDFD